MGLSITALADDYAVAPQVTPADLPGLAAQGFRTLINHRPDGEGGAAQPRHEELAKAASKAGMQSFYIPVVPHAMQPADVVRLERALANAPRPVLAFCATGQRATAAWQVWQAGQQTGDA